jgi:hypothetical protein
MVFKETSRQGHLVGSLDQPCTEVTHRLILTLRHIVKGGGKELLAKALSCRKVLHCSVLITVHSVNYLLRGLPSCLDCEQ